MPYERGMQSESLWKCTSKKNRHASVIVCMKYLDYWVEYVIWMYTLLIGFARRNPIILKTPRCGLNWKFKWLCCDYAYWALKRTWSNGFPCCRMQFSDNIRVARKFSIISDIFQSRIMRCIGAFIAIFHFNILRYSSNQPETPTIQLNGLRSKRPHTHLKDAQECFLNHWPLEAK